MPCAEVEIGVEHGEKDGQLLYTAEGEPIMFVVPRVQAITGEPGRLYFAAGDAGTTSDSYAICVLSIDNSSDSVPWLCPVCGRDPEVRAGLPYVQVNRDNLLTLGDYSGARRDERNSPRGTSGTLRVGTSGTLRVGTSGTLRVAGDA